MTTTFPGLTAGADLMNQWVDWVRGHHDDDIPAPGMTPSALGKWWLDEMSMQTELVHGRLRIPDIAFRRRLREELTEARLLYDEQGWIKNPRSYHQDPPASTNMTLKSAPFRGLPLERFRFDSDFEPHADEPGREQWLNYPKGNEAAGWILRHCDGQERPWIFVVNGYRTGDIGVDLMSLMSCLDDDLACVIAGVPESDLVRGMRRHIDPYLPPFYEQWGLSWGPLERVFAPVSPLAMETKVAHDRRYIYAGLLDRWVRPGNVKTLWEHWDQPSIHWYQGSHLSFPFEKPVKRYVDDALREALPVTT